MTYDILIKNGRVVDGSGSPGFNADVGIRNGKIAEIGKLRGSAKRTIDAKGQVVAPGFIDSHTHFDAQVTWASKWVWESMKPGATTWPLASIVRLASPRSLPISAILPLRIPTSALNAGQPDPSTMRPFLMSMS